MIDQTAQHCPYLGLKQNQAIRFSDPTPEHRCYAAGGAQDIPQSQADYQASYCLTADHRRCPLYTGLVYTTTQDGRAEPLRRRGPAGWLDGLATTERRTYLTFITGLGLLLLIYVLLATSWLLDQRRDALRSPSPLPTAAPNGVLTPAQTAAVSATALQPTQVSATATMGATATASATASATATATLTATVRRPTLVLPTLTGVPYNAGASAIPQLPTATATFAATPPPEAATTVPADGLTATVSGTTESGSGLRQP